MFVIVFISCAGFITHAGVVQIVLYWLLHLIHLFFKFFFPFAIRRVDTKNWKRAFHIGEVIFVNVTTCIAPIYILIKSKYYPYGYPPNLCIPNADLTFYSGLLPIVIFLCTGTCLLVLMFWRLQMVSILYRVNPLRKAPKHTCSWSSLYFGAYI